MTIAIMNFCGLFTAKNQFKAVSSTASFCIEDPEDIYIYIYLHIIIYVCIYTYNYNL